MALETTLIIEKFFKKRTEISDKVLVFCNVFLYGVPGARN